MAFITMNCQQQNGRVMTPVAMQPGDFQKNKQFLGFDYVIILKETVFMYLDSPHHFENR